MKSYYGNYLGVVISNKDPETRGRVQVFVPHIMPTLYKDWNEKGEDITISCVGDNIQNALKSDIIERLTKILPWAEAASPIIGGSSPGNLTPSAIGGMIGGMIGGAVAGEVGKAAGTAVGQAIGGVFNQEPTAKPDTSSGGATGGLIDRARGITGLAMNDAADWGMCARGTTGLDKAAGLIDNTGAAAGFGQAADLTRTGTYNPYTTGEGAKNFNPPFKVDASTYKPQIGDSVYCSGGRRGSQGQFLGHAQKCIGFRPDGTAIWHSDKPQSKFFTNTSSGPYTDFTVYRLNDAGLAKYKAAAGIAGDAPAADPAAGGTDKQTAESANPAAIPPITRPDGQVPTTAPTPQTGTTPTETGGLVAGPPGTGTPAGTVSGGGTVSDGIAKLAADRQAAFANELKDPAVLQRLSYLAWQEVDRTGKGTVGSGAVATGTKYDQQANFIETVVNRAHFSGRSLTAVLNESAYGFKPGTSPINPTTQKAFEAVMGGRNNTNLATDNASNQSAGNGGTVALKRIQNNVTGTWYENGKPVSPERAAILNTTVPTPNGVEFFYRADGINGYATGAGKKASQYATANGIDTSTASTGFTSGVPTDSPLAAPSTGPSVVNNTDPGGPTTVVNTNDSAKGLFAYPNPGAMVWVFFREGNPLYPVYFAASYSASEWSSAYRGASESDGYANNEQVISTATHFNPNRAGGLTFNVTTDLTDPSGLQDKASVLLYGDDGSNMMLAKGQHQIYTRHNRRDQVDRDRFETTMGFKEQWVEGDYSINVRGNYILKIGKIDQETMDALQKLADYSSQINSQLTNSGGGGGGADASVLDDPTLPENLQKTIDDGKLINELAPEGELDINKDLGSQVPAYLQANATEADKAKFFADSKALIDSRKGYIGENYTTQQGTMTPGSQLPRYTTATPGDLAGVNASKAQSFTPVGASWGGWSSSSSSNQSPTINSGTPSRATAIAASTGSSTLRTDSQSRRQFSTTAEKNAAAIREARNQIRGS